MFDIRIGLFWFLLGVKCYTPGILIFFITESTTESKDFISAFLVWSISSSTEWVGDNFSIIPVNNLLEKI